MKENEDRQIWRGILCSCIGKHTIKMPILPKFIYSFNAIPIKIPMAYFTGIFFKSTEIRIEPKRP